MGWEPCDCSEWGPDALLKRRGLALDATPEDLDPLHDSEPLLAECAAASLQGVVLIGPRAGRSVWRLGSAPQQTPDAAPPPKPAHGFDLHTGCRVSANDRGGLERLLRYIMRPPLSHDRITLTDHGRVRLRLKRRWSDGTTHQEFDPRDFIARLVPLVPPPRKHQVTTDCSHRAPSFDRPSSPSRPHVTTTHSSSSPRKATRRHPSVRCVRACSASAGPA